MRWVLCPLILYNPWRYHLIMPNPGNPLQVREHMECNYPEKKKECKLEALLLSFQGQDCLRTLSHTRHAIWTLHAMKGHYEFRPQNKLDFNPDPCGTSLSHLFFNNFQKSVMSSFQINSLQSHYTGWKLSSQKNWI